ncbi:MAG: hypothetical protein LAQ69_49430 [Acidobacteriia bacterium]|nr:hypothetical protein [Terriglobia bacterium]
MEKIRLERSGVSSLTKPVPGENDPCAAPREGNALEYVEPPAMMLPLAAIARATVSSGASPPSNVEARMLNWESSLVTKPSPSPMLPIVPGREGTETTLVWKAPAVVGNGGTLL